MATVTHGVGLAVTTNAATYTTGSFTPAVDDLLLLFAVVTGTVDAGDVSDSLGGTWTFITNSVKAASADRAYCFIRNALSNGAALTVTMDVTGDNGTGCVIAVARISGMTRTGANASRQSAIQSNQAAGTPAPSFPAACLTENATLGFVANATNPAGMTPPTDWTELVADTGYNTPTTGGEYVVRNSGFTGTTITWGNASASAFCDIIIELDTSVPPVVELSGASMALVGIGH